MCIQQAQSSFTIDVDAVVPQKSLLT